MGKGWAARRSRKLFAGLTVIVGLSVPYFAGEAAGAMLKGNYQLNWDKTVDKTEAGTTDVTKFQQIVELGYNGFFSPAVANALMLKVEQEVNSDSSDLVRWQPQLDIGFSGKFWRGAAGVKRLNESSDEVGKNPKTTDNFFVELFYLPPKSIPDLKAKYTLDRDYEEGVTDTVKQGLIMSSLFNFKNWLAFKGDYAKNQLDDRLKVDADTKDDKLSGSVALKYLLSEKIKYDTQYLSEIATGSTLKDDGSGDVPGTTKKDTTQTWKNALSFRPFTDTSIDGTYDYDLKKNKVTGQQDLTVNSKVWATQKIAAIYDARGEFVRNVTEARNTEDDNRKTEDTLTLEIRARFLKQLDFAFKYQDKNTTEDHEDPSKNKTSGSTYWNATWYGDLTPYWRASISLDLTDTYDMGTKISEETKYSLRTTYVFQAVNLTLDPVYDVTIKDDLVRTVTTEVRDFKFNFAYLLVGTRTIEARLVHTYGRKTDSLLKNIQRTDNTSGNVIWKAIPGWILGFDVTRNASDTSGDDLGPDVSTTLGFKADCFTDRFAFNTTYKYDIKTIGDNSENFDAKVGWRAPKWDVTLTYNFKKTFSAVINEGYAITFMFKYNL